MKIKSILGFLGLIMTLLALIFCLSGCESNANGTDFDFSVIWNNPVADVIGDILILIPSILLLISFIPLILIVLVISLIVFLVSAIIKFLGHIIVSIIVFFATHFG